jgi:hypothetical protein
MYRAFRQQQLVGGGVIVKKFYSAFLIPVIALAAAIAIPAVAQDKSKAPAKAEKSTSTVKMHFENDKVRVFERSYKPGDTNTEVPSSSYRVNRTLKGGTLERTYSDGKKEKIELKEGTVRWLEPSKGGATYTVRNVGKTEIVNYVIVLK